MKKNENLSNAKVTIAMRRCVVNGKRQEVNVFSFHIENRTEIGNFSRFLNDRTLGDTEIDNKIQHQSDWTFICRSRKV